MSEEKTKKELTEQEKKDLESLRIVQFALADSHFKLTTRVQYLPEEFEQATKNISVLVSLHADVTKKINEIDPPATKAEEPKKPYIMDLSHVKAEEKKEEQNEEKSV